MNSMFQVCVLQLPPYTPLPLRFALAARMRGNNSVSKAVNLEIETANNR
ncbi:hypothetical protein ABID60_007014 [Bradyrhizobium sp. S3.5.5]